MKAPIVFSIPVHENPLIVKNHIDNLIKFVPNCVIVLHISLDTKNIFNNQAIFENANLHNIPNVYINPVNLQSTYSQGFLYTIHISNFEYISSILDFDYIALESSNTMLCRYGLYDYMSKYDFGADYNCIDNERTGQAADNIRSDGQLMDMIKINNWKFPFVSQIEGSFYKKDIFSEIIKYIDKYYTLERRKSYASEEIIFPTVAYNIIDNPNVYGPYIDIFYGSYNGLFGNGLEDISKDLIDRIYNGEYKSQWKRDTYGIKRVLRNFNPIREYITNLK